MSILKGDNAKVKDIMKENKNILKEDTSSHLLGEKFDDKITEFVKKNSKEFSNIMDRKKKESNLSTTRVTSTSSPFVGPPPQLNWRGSRTTSQDINLATTKLVSQDSFVFLFPLP